LTLAQYEANLRQIVARLQGAAKARLIWATTTPVVDEWHARAKLFRRRQADVERYNRAALKVMKAAGVEIDDLHAVVQRAGVERCVSPDGVHMTEEGNRLLAEAVAGSIAAQ
jgi:lysophospholipase L1-like esterase